MQFRKNQDKIGRYALLTMFFAVLSTLASLGLSAQVTSEHEQLEKHVMEHSDRLAHHLKEQAFRLQMELFQLNQLVGTGSPDVQNFIRNKVKEYDAHTLQLEEEKERVQKMGEDLILQSQASQHQQQNLKRAVLWMQCGILVAALATMARIKILWFASFLVGMIGVTQFVKIHLPWFH